MFGFKLENFGNKIEHFTVVEWDLCRIPISGLPMKFKIEYGYRSKV